MIAPIASLYHVIPVKTDTNKCSNFIMIFSIKKVDLVHAVLLYSWFQNMSVRSRFPVIFSKKESNCNIFSATLF